MKDIIDIINERYANNEEFKRFMQECYFSNRKQRRLRLKTLPPKWKKVAKAELILLRKLDGNS